MDVEREVIEYIQQYIRYGFYQIAEIERIIGEDIFDGQIPRKELRELIKAEAELQTAEQQCWPAITDCDRLDQAFTALEADGVLAIHNAGNAPSEGIDEMSERYSAAGGESSGIIGYCFYHRQDVEYALKHHELGLAFGDINGDPRRGVKIGQRVRKALEVVRLHVVWSGSIKDKLNITNFRWLRRYITA